MIAVVPLTDRHVGDSVQKELTPWPSSLMAKSSSAEKVPVGDSPAGPLETSTATEKMYFGGCRSGAQAADH